VVIPFGLAFERLGDTFKRKQHAKMRSNCASNKAQLENWQNLEYFGSKWSNLGQIHRMLVLKRVTSIGSRATVTHHYYLTLILALKVGTSYTIYVVGCCQKQLKQHEW